jgi:hypothetical protein
MGYPRHFLTNLSMATTKKGKSVLGWGGLSADIFLVNLDIVAFGGDVC